MYIKFCFVCNNRIIIVSNIDVKSSRTKFEPYEYILYYCNQHSPTSVYQIDLSDVCSLYYDGSGNLQISSWFLGGFGQPSPMSTLLTYVLANVLQFCNNFYTIPSLIAANEPYMISTSDLSNARADNSMKGFVIYDTTVQSNKYFDGTTWGTTESKYLSSNGGTLNGNLDMGTNNISSIGTIYQSSPSCISIYSNSNSSISFVANTPKLINLGSFSQLVNGKSDFSSDSSTGHIPDLQHDILE